MIEVSVRVSRVLGVIDVIDQCQLWCCVGVCPSVSVVLPAVSSDSTNRHHQHLHHQLSHL